MKQLFLLLSLAIGMSAAYSLDLAGHHRNGFVWDVRYSDKYAHAYKNSHDGYVPNTLVNLPSGNLKVLLGYQQNRRKEFEESPDTCGLYMQLHTINYDVRYVTEEFAGWKLSTGFNGMVQRSLNLGAASLRRREIRTDTRRQGV